ncbi:YkgJ family cysteine cluster protein [Stenotrophomonas sp. ISL-67]|uniref:YkgJ family cysteine cluster protein n=1 Tax=Stenotrophomonas sp. ISL-67 TaxID=2819171 RepID=UPI001BEA37B5|nr:YkgJ family cysteine cluster protein [Stenotrophomonas sp. ISL-67]MBT2766790.1 YkgJ family cysteine cluster protein [Stenotrophomonas sp. ISL-67]
MATPHCSRCAAQCCRLTAVLAPSESLPPELTVEIAGGQRAMAKGADGWCVALDRSTMACGIYAERPLVCRRFKMAGPYCSAIFGGGDQA